MDLKFLLVFLCCHLAFDVLKSDGIQDLWLPPVWGLRLLLPLFGSSFFYLLKSMEFW
jgi:hypothetical protein